MNNHNPLSPPPRDRNGARKSAQIQFDVREQRADVIRQEIDRERAETDAKTQKLRALRLAKEETDREAAALAALNAPAANSKKSRKRLVLR